MNQCNICAGPAANGLVCADCLAKDALERKQEAQMAEIQKAIGRGILTEAQVRDEIKQMGWDSASVAPLKDIAKAVAAAKSKEASGSLLEEVIQLTPEEQNGVRKFFKAMKKGVYIHCPQCEQWKHNPTNPAVEDSVIFCSPKCRSDYMNNVWRNAMKTTSGQLQQVGRDITQGLAQGMAQASERMQTLRETWMTTDGVEITPPQNARQADLARMTAKRVQDREARQKGLR